MRPRCDFGECGHEPALQLVARDEDGVTLERRPMCERHARYAATIYRASIEALNEETPR